MNVKLEGMTRLSTRASCWSWCRC